LSVILIYYIWFTDSLISAGSYESDNKMEAQKEIQNMIRTKTTDRFGCLISDKIDFASELEQREDIEEYLNNLLFQTNFKEEEK
jgi:hypothetical protein